MATKTEQKLTEIWCQVLETAVRVDDEFINLGGDSLTAMMCISKVRRLFGKELPILDFFLEGATIKRFAAELDAQDTRSITTQT